MANTRSAKKMVRKIARVGVKAFTVLKVHKSTAYCAEILIRT